MSIDNVVTELVLAWSRETSSDPVNWSDSNPAYGQCAVSALVIQSVMGGDLLRAKVGSVSHYWNRLSCGIELDVTRGQFDPDTAIPRGEIRTREYVLSFEETKNRYDRLMENIMRLRA